MDTVGDLCLVGLSHRTAPVAVRERYAVRPEDLPVRLGELVAGEMVEEICLLSTCNRTEALVRARDTSDPALRDALFNGCDEGHIYVYRGVHAIIHLFRVAGGLDSQVMGESEILSQVKVAFEASRRAGTVGKVLQPLFTHALSVGKRVRTETELGLGTLSVARVGVDLAARVFGSFERRRALVVGAGETGLLVARHLKDRGVGGLDFANRTLSRAEDAARELGGRAFGIDDIASPLQDADLVVTCLEDCPRLLDKKSFDRKRLAKRDRPLLVIDLSVPRVVAEEVAQLDNLLYYDLDDLEPVIEKNRENRGLASELATGILVSEVHKFLSLRTYASFSPAIAQLRRRFKEVSEEVLDTVVGGEAAAREVQLADELVRRLLDLSLDQMKESARYTRSEEALDREYQRFLENL